MPEQCHVVMEVLDLTFPPQPEGFEGLKSTVAKLALPFLDLLESPGFVQALVRIFFQLTGYPDSCANGIAPRVEPSHGLGN